MPPKLTPKMAYQLARGLHKAGVPRDPRLEAIIKRSAEVAYVYAWDVLGGRFPAAEPTIKKSPKYRAFYEYHFGSI